MKRNTSPHLTRIDIGYLFPHISCCLFNHSIDNFVLLCVFTKMSNSLSFSKFNYSSMTVEVNFILIWKYFSTKKENFPRRRHHCRLLSLSWIGNACDRKYSTFDHFDRNFNKIQPPPLFYHVNTHSWLGKSGISFWNVSYYIIERVCERVYDWFSSSLFWISHQLVEYTNLRETYGKHLDKQFSIRLSLTDTVPEKAQNGMTREWFGHFKYQSIITSNFHSLKFLCIVTQLCFSCSFSIWNQIDQPNCSPIEIKSNTQLSMLDTQNTSLVFVRLNICMKILLDRKFKIEKTHLEKLRKCKF